MSSLVLARVAENWLSDKVLKGRFLERHLMHVRGVLSLILLLKVFVSVWLHLICTCDLHELHNETMVFLLWF